MAKLHQLGFTTWVTHVSEMVDTYLLDINCSPAEFKSECKMTVGNRFINMWTEQVLNIHSNPILRTHCDIKCNFGMETYLDAIKNYKYRVAMSQLRTSSHTLAIEYGRYTRPKTKIEDRKCSSCHILEDEKHFLIECNINQAKRENLFSKLTHIAPNFIHMTDKECMLLCIHDHMYVFYVCSFYVCWFYDVSFYLWLLSQRWSNKEVQTKKNIQCYSTLLCFLMVMSPFFHLLRLTISV